MPYQRRPIGKASWVLVKHWIPSFINTTELLPSVPVDTLMHVHHLPFECDVEYRKVVCTVAWNGYNHRSMHVRPYWTRLSWHETRSGAGFTGPPRRYQEWTVEMMSIVWAKLMMGRCWTRDSISEHMPRIFYKWTHSGLMRWMRPSGPRSSPVQRSHLAVFEYDTGRICKITPGTMM